MAQAQHGQNDWYSLNDPSDVKEFKMSRRRRRTRTTRTSKNGNENSKKATGLDKQKNNFPVPNIMFYRERKQTTTNFSFSFWALIFFPWNSASGELAHIKHRWESWDNRAEVTFNETVSLPSPLLYVTVPFIPASVETARKPALTDWQNKSMNRMDASLFDYKNRDQVHFSVTTKAFSLCQKLPYILSNLRDIYTSFHNTLPIAETD